MPPITELFNIDWQETSFVPAGDNPEARLVFWKAEPDLSAEEIEGILADVENGIPPASLPPEGEPDRSLIDKGLDYIRDAFGLRREGIPQPLPEAKTLEEMAKAWDGSASRYPSTEAYCSACLIDENTGSEKSQAKCHLPIKDPGGKVNKAGVAAAVQRFGQVKASPEAKEKARKRLVSLHKSLFGGDPPDSIAKAAPEQKEVEMPLNDEQLQAVQEIPEEDLRAYVEGLGGGDSDDSAEETPVEKMLKEFPEDHPLRKEMERLQAESTDNAQKVEKMLEDAAMTRLEKRARGAGAEDPQEFAKTLRTIEKSLGEEEAEKVAMQLQAANQKAGVNLELLTEERQAPGGGTTNMEKIEKVNQLAQERIDAEPEKFGKIADPGARLAAARSEVYSANPDLREDAS
jgi:hypothetical protein